jgi:hypothetical protein
MKMMRSARTQGAQGMGPTSEVTLLKNSGSCAERPLSSLGLRCGYIKYAGGEVCIAHTIRGNRVRGPTERQPLSIGLPEFPFTVGA